MIDKKASKSRQTSQKKDNAPAEPSFYSDIFNRKQSIFFYWAIFNFSEETFDFIASKMPDEKTDEKTDEKEVSRWITKEIKSLMDCFFPEENIDTRRFAILYRKGMKKKAIDKTTKMPESLFYILKGMFNSKFTLANKEKKPPKKKLSKEEIEECARKKIEAETEKMFKVLMQGSPIKTPVKRSDIREIQVQRELLRLKECYLTDLGNWPNLFLPCSTEISSGKGILIEKELKKFKVDIKKLLGKCFEKPFPILRTYQAFIFSANILFELLRYPCPNFRENEFAIFSLLTYKAIFNLCNAIPFEYPILKDVAYKFKELQECARKQSDIADGAFLDTLVSYMDSAFKKPSETSFPDPDKFKVSDKYIKTLTQDFTHDKLHPIAQYLSNECGDDCNGLIYWLIKQVAVGLIISEQTEDKNHFTSLLEQDQKSADSNLPQILFLIASGLNSYSAAYDHKRTLLANETKKRKNSRSIKE